MQVRRVLILFYLALVTQYSGQMHPRGPKQQPAAPTSPAAFRCFWTLFVLTETRFTHLTRRGWWRWWYSSRWTGLFTGSYGSGTRQTPDPVHLSIICTGITLQTRTSIPPPIILGQRCLARHTLWFIGGLNGTIRFNREPCGNGIFGHLNGNRGTGRNGRNWAWISSNISCGGCGNVMGVMSQIGIFVPALRKVPGWSGGGGYSGRRGRLPTWNVLVIVVISGSVPVYIWIVYVVQLLRLWRSEKMENIDLAKFFLLWKQIADFVRFWKHFCP